jgi:hypothetical protein
LRDNAHVGSKKAFMKFIAQLTLFCISAYFLISAVGIGWLLFGLAVLALANLGK